ncbi:MAG: ECF transporter S component [Lachnospiraceae bacterium]|nr:ECF transporter S component [Lachnospiraceae bacterium]
MKTKKLVMAALFAALTYVATSIIKIPTPGTGGYIHPGDAIVILSGIFLGPVYGGLSAAIGSMLSDLLGGYMNYVPITFVIKGLVAVAAYFVFHMMMKLSGKMILSIVMCGICGTILVAGGYFLCEIPMYGFGGALASIPANIIQGCGGLVISTVLMTILYQVPDVKAMTQEA